VLEEALSGTRDEAFDAKRGCVTSISLATSSNTRYHCGRHSTGSNSSLTSLRASVIPTTFYVAVKPAPPPALRPWPANASAGAMGSDGESGQRRAARGWSTRSATALPRSRRVCPTLGGTGAWRLGAGPELSCSVGRRRQRTRSTAGPGARRASRSAEGCLRPGSSAADALRDRLGLLATGATARSATLGPQATATDQREGRWWRVEPSPRAVDGQPWAVCDWRRPAAPS
jgi:hypothetical protein